MRKGVKQANRCINVEFIDVEIRLLINENDFTKTYESLQEKFI